MILDLEQLHSRFVRSFRKSNFDLYLWVIYELCGWLFVFDQTTTHAGYQYMSSPFDNPTNMDEHMSLPGKLLMVVMESGEISGFVVIKMLYPSCLFSRAILF